MKVSDAPLPSVDPMRRVLCPSGWMAAALALALAACGGSGAPSPAAGPATEAGYFSLPAAQLAHLRIAPATRVSWPVTVRTTGTVDFDGDHTTQVITQASGPISRIVVDLGTRVKAGDPLLYVSSPDLAGAVSAYRKAANRLELARLALERNRDLLDHKAIAQKEFEASQADYNDASTDLQNSLDALRILGVTDRELADARRQDAAIRPEFALRSPIAGVVVQKLVLPGQVVQAGATPCFLVSDPSRVWVQAHAHEPDLAMVGTGREAEVTSPTSGAALRGTVTFVGAMLDEATRTIPVRVSTPNPGGVLKKGEFVDVMIHAGTMRDVVVVPTSAVLYTNENLPFVYIQVEPGKFAQRLITVGAQQDGRFEVLSGIRAGDPIVTDGSVFLQFAQASER